MSLMRLEIVEASRICYISAVQKFQTRVAESLAGKRLDQVLQIWLPEQMAMPLSKSKIRKLIVAGAVYLNRKRVRIASKPVFKGASLEVYVDLEKLKDTVSEERTRFDLADRHVLFEDDFLIAVNKPTRLPTQPTLDEARDNLFAATKRFLVQKTGKPDVYLGLHHRLDRDTSGVVLFTKAKEANAGVGDLFSKRGLEKVYQAIARVNSQFAGSWETENYLAKIGKTKGSKFGSVKSGGDYAQTLFKVLRRAGKGILVEARPKTGRTHQIRVHLAENGMPIFGDALYGGDSAPRMMLHLSSTLGS